MMLGKNINYNNTPILINSNNKHKNQKIVIKKIQRQILIYNSN